ncbi:MAG: histone deacetylase family protein [Bdellovibrionota bacterium]
MIKSAKKKVSKVEVFFDPAQLKHKPLYEWAFGKRLIHPESSNRAERIVSELRKNSQTFTFKKPTTSPLRHILKIHHPKLVAVLRESQRLPKGYTFHPSVFPRRDQVYADPRELNQAGFYCFDSGTPLTAYTWGAAVGSASCALAAAQSVGSGKSNIAYSLCRPPGHHAQFNLFGGYSYFNNAAIAATYLRAKGRVAIVDIDFHHGNGTQSIFYKDNQVYVASIHGDPKEFYPFFSGFKTEIGEGPGKGFNLNVPLPRGCDIQEFVKKLKGITAAVKRFDPKFLIISAGFDTFVKDPIGDFTLETDDFALVAEELAKLSLPAVILQEGGYATRWLGKNVATFLQAYVDSAAKYEIKETSKRLIK